MADLASLPENDSSSRDNVAAALSALPPTNDDDDRSGPSVSSNSKNPWSAMTGVAAGVGSLVASATKRSVAGSAPNWNGGGGGEDHNNKSAVPPSQSPPPSGNAFFSNLTSNLVSSVSNLNSSVSSATANLNASVAANLSDDNHPLSSLTSTAKSIGQQLSHGIAGRNTLPDKTTASQVLMFRQLLHTKCRPGLRLSRRYEGTAAQRAVLHMPWWERGIEQSKKMIISYDNLITRLWLSGAIMPFERGGYATTTSARDVGGEGLRGAIDTLINERGLPPVPHQYWVDRLGFQQDDPVTDFRSGGVLSLAMLVHIVESCPAVHSRFVPKLKATDAKLSTLPDESDGSAEKEVISLEEIITDDASVLPFGITCINITDMLAKFLLFSKAVDKMDALLSAKPFWKMFIDPNAMLVLQEVSLDLLCDVCVEIGRERRMKRLEGMMGKKEGEQGAEKPGEVSSGMPGSRDGKVTVFDFSEIMERTERRVGDEVLGPGPRNVDELRAVARRVKSKYLMRIQLKEKHSPANAPTNPQLPQLPPMPSKESVKNATGSVIGGVGGFVSLLKKQSSSGKTSGEKGGNAGGEEGVPPTPGGQEVEVHLDGTTSVPGDCLPGPPGSSANLSASSGAAEASADAEDELEKLSAELGDLSAATAEAFDLLGDDFNQTDLDDNAGHSEELLDAMDGKVDPFAAFAIDDDEFLP